MRLYSRKTLALIALYIILILVFTHGCSANTDSENTTTSTTSTLKVTTKPIYKSNPKDKRAKKILNRSSCLTCHNIKYRVVGPAYYDVADRYRQDEAAKEFLKNKVRKGGKGNWGGAFMPPNPPSRISDEDLDYIVTWILGLERKKK